MDTEEDRKEQCGANGTGANGTGANGTKPLLLLSSTLWPILSPASQKVEGCLTCVRCDRSDLVRRSMQPCISHQKLSLASVTRSSCNRGTFPQPSPQASQGPPVSILPGAGTQQTCQSYQEQVHSRQEDAASPTMIPAYAACMPCCQHELNLTSIAHVHSTSKHSITNSL